MANSFAQTPRSPSASSAGNAGASSSLDNTEVRPPQPLPGQSPGAATPNANASPNTERTKPMSDIIDKSDSDRIKDDASAVKEDVSVLTRDAVDAIRKIADSLTAQAGAKATEAVNTAKAAGTATVEGIGSVADGARAMTESGIDALGKSVQRNPLTALAIAAGTGLVLGWMTRDDRR